jgi:hypothetical protein
MSNTTIMPDAGTDIAIEAMELAAVERELRSYEPAMASAVAHGDEHRERRARLWRRLDALTRPAAGTAPQRGAQQA